MRPPPHSADCMDTNSSLSDLLTLALTSDPWELASASVDWACDARDPNPNASLGFQISVLRPGPQAPQIENSGENHGILPTLHMETVLNGNAQNPQLGETCMAKGATPIYSTRSYTFCPLALAPTSSHPPMYLATDSADQTCHAPVPNANPWFSFQASIPKALLSIPSIWGHLCHTTGLHISARMKSYHLELGKSPRAGETSLAPGGHTHIWQC